MDLHAADIHSKLRARAEQERNAYGNETWLARLCHDAADLIHNAYLRQDVVDIEITGDWL